MTEFTGKVFPTIFESAFLTGTKVEQGNAVFSFEFCEIGKINIESGKIIVCDPIVMRDGIPFSREFPKGRFPVQLALAKSASDERVAFCRILFSDEPVVKWELALQPGQTPIELRDSIFYCYGVDGAMGIFIDDQANKAFSSKNADEWHDAFVKKAEQNGYSRGYIHDFEGTNLAAFFTGYGDGCYATYIGSDRNNQVCRLLSDFALIDWWLGKKD